MYPPGKKMFRERQIGGMGNGILSEKETYFSHFLCIKSLSNYRLPNILKETESQLTIT